MEVEVEAGKVELISPTVLSINTYGDAVPCDGVIALVLMRKEGGESGLQRQGWDKEEASRCISGSHPLLFCFH